MAAGVAAVGVAVAVAVAVAVTVAVVIAASATNVDFNNIVCIHGCWCCRAALNVIFSRYCETPQKILDDIFWCRVRLGRCGGKKYRVIQEDE